MYNELLIPENTKDLDDWFEKLAKDFYKEIGTKPGHTILDVGSGVGTYTIPAAKAVGVNGTVYAIDKNEKCIKELKERIAANNLSTIVQPILTDGSFTFPINDESIDTTLLCDFIGVVLHNTNNVRSIEELMKEIHRLTTSSGKVIIIFKHTKNWRIPKSKVDPIIEKYFSLENEFTIPHIHWNFKEIDSVFSFIKKQ